MALRHGHDFVFVEGGKDGGYFWNLRACDIELFFYDPNSAERLRPFVEAYSACSATGCHYQELSWPTIKQSEPYTIHRACAWNGRERQNHFASRIESGGNVRNLGA
jgi:hypothetical protein